MMEFVAPDLIPALAEIWLACAGMALLMAGLFAGRAAMSVVSNGALVALAIAALIVLSQGDARILGFGDQVIFDGFARYLKLLILLGAGLAILLAGGYLRREGLARFEYPVLIVFAALGMMVMVSAHDIITLYVGLEMQSLSAYVLAAIRRDNLKASEAGLKYFVLGALASGLLLYGASLVYGFTGSTRFDLIAAVLAQEPAPIGSVVGLVFIAAALAFKVSAAPFHMWTPDVYEGAATPVTAFFAMAPKVAAIGLTLRVLLDPFLDLASDWQQIFILVALASMIVGAFAALRQTNIKRLLAYSSIGHMGYALVGVAAAAAPGVEIAAARSVVLYMLIYLVMSAGTFAVVLTLRRMGQWVEQIDDMAGLSRSHPGLALAMAVLMFSMAGIPPLAGFFGKLYVFMAAVEAGLIWLAIAGVLASVVAAFYYLRIIKVMYFDEPADSLEASPEGAVRAVLVAATLFSLAAVVALGPLVGGADEAARALLAP